MTATPSPHKRGEKERAKLQSTCSRRPFGEAVVVVFRIESGVDVEPGAHAPVVELWRLAVGRHRSRVADTVFVRVRRDAGHLLSLTRRQRESRLRTAGLHGELAVP